MKYTPKNWLGFTVLALGLTTAHLSNTQPPTVPATPSQAAIGAKRGTTVTSATSTIMVKKSTRPIVRRRERTKGRVTVKPSTSRRGVAAFIQKKSCKDCKEETKKKA